MSAVRSSRIKLRWLISGVSALPRESRPDRSSNRIFGHRPRTAHSGISSPELAVELNPIQCPINHRFQFVEVLHLASLRQALFGFLWREPRRLPIRLIRLAHLVDL